MDSLASWAGDVGAYLPRIVGAIVIFIIGWIVALILRTVVRKLLGRFDVNEKLSGKTGTSLNIEKIAASVVFWVVLLFALIGAFNVLDLSSVSGPLKSLADAIMLYLPRVLLAAALAVIAWVVATVANKLVSKGLAATGLDEKLASQEDAKSTPISETLGNVVFWLIILLFLPAIVAALQMRGLMTPLTNMVHELLGFIPNIIAALFIGGIGYLIAKVLREVVTGLLSVTRVDSLTQGKDGKDGIRISKLCGTLVFILVLVPALIAALEALQLEVIAQPAEHMLRLAMNAIPNILAAALILFIAWFIGRFIAQMLAQLLGEAGFDRLPAHLGLKPATAEAGATEGTHLTPSELVGRIVLIFVMAFATVEAANRLGFSSINGLIDQLISFAAHVAFGIIIIMVGLWLANMAAKAIRHASGKNSSAMANITRIGILGLVIAMGVHAMGFADSIVNLAFGLALGSVAVAVAIAFGVGGRDSAGQITRHWVDGYLGNDKDGNGPQR